VNALAEKEDVKAALRKRFGSVASFEREKGLPEKSVSDLLRGRPSARVRDAVKEAISQSSPSRGSELSDDTANAAAPHRKKARAR
jgi:hypothetical protein